MSSPSTSNRWLLDLTRRTFSPSLCATPVLNCFSAYVVFDLVDRDGGGTVTKEELGELVRGANSV